MGEFLFILLFVGGTTCWGMYYIIKTFTLLMKWDMKDMEEEEKELLCENNFLRNRIRKLEI